MRIAVLGSGQVGRTVAAGLVKAGHGVVLGTREPSRADLVEWAGGAGVQLAEPAPAVRLGEIVVNATPGTAAEQALADAGMAELDAVILLDLANPLDMSAGFPPKVLVSNSDSLAERLQRVFPKLRVVKALNTVNNSVMVDPGQLSEPTAIFLSGDDASAKAGVRTVLESLGWQPDQIFDLGGLATARSAEAYLMLWLDLMRSLGTPQFNIRVVR
jgi:predicted dinucleotide-binding enzyme